MAIYRRLPKIMYMASTRKREAMKERKRIETQYTMETTRTWSASRLRAWVRTFRPETEWDAEWSMFFSWKLSFNFVANPPYCFYDPRIPGRFVQLFPESADMDHDGVVAV